MPRPKKSTPLEQPTKRVRRPMTAADIDALNTEGVAQYNEQPKAALALAQRAAAAARRIGYANGFAQSQLVIGTAHWRLADYEQSKLYLEAATALFTACGEPESAARALNNLGLLYDDLADFPQAVSCYTRSLRTWQQRDNHQRIAMSLGNLGVVYRKLGAYSVALEYFYQSLSVLQSSAEETAQHEAAALNNIGNTLENLEDYPAALEYHRRSLQLWQRLRESRSTAASLNNLGNVYKELGNYPEALSCYQASYEIKVRLNFHQGIPDSFQNFGDLCEKTGDDASALDYYAKGLEGYRATGNRAAVSLSLYSLGMLFFKRGDVDAALETLQASLSAASELGLKPGMADAHLGLSQVYHRLGDLAQTYQHHVRYHALEREIFNERVANQTKALQIRYEVEQKEKENEVLRLRSEKLEQETSRQKQELVSLAMALVEKNEFIDKLKTDLAEISSLSVPCETKFADMLHQLDRERSAEQSWKLFEQQFSGVYSDFIARLTAHCNTLTPVELKIAAFLKLNLATKDIARALNTSPRTVDNHRHRLRAKLRLKASENMSSFLSSL